MPRIQSIVQMTIFFIFQLPPLSARVQRASTCTWREGSFKHIIKPATPSGTYTTVRAMSLDSETTQKISQNVLGGPLELCCNSPKTGFYRDGFCNTGPQDFGVHTVCARVTDEFLEFSKARGNDLISPAPAYGFPGLKDGDGWCLCASRWLEAARAGKACPVVLAATHEKTLQTVPLDLLKQYAIDFDVAQKEKEN